jgi:hypothetical protein
VAASSTTIVTTTSYMNQALLFNQFKFLLTTSRVLGSTVDVHVALHGKVIINSPFMGWTVLPGFFDLQSSDIIELNLKTSYLSSPNAFKRTRCYVGAICTFRMTLKDVHLNLVNHQAGVLKDYDMQEILTGPFGQIDGFEAHNRYVMNLTQYFPSHHEWYFINFSVE